MLTLSLAEPVPIPFDFESAARSHGWSALVPFTWDAAMTTLSRVQQLQSSGKVIRLHLREGQANGSAPFVAVEVETAEPLTPGEEVEIRRAVRRMVRLNEDFRHFQDLDQSILW